MQVSVVIGGGNIFRGDLSSQWGIERAEADNIGMMGTVVNSLMLRGVLSSKSGGDVEPYIRLRAIQHLKKGYVVIFAGGLGQPYLTTDYPAVQRALETRSNAILYAKNGARGVFTADPKTDPQARMYRRMHYNTILSRDLRVIDQTAVILARDNGLPLHLFDVTETGTVQRICEGEDAGTLVADVSEDLLE